LVTNPEGGQVPESILFPSIAAPDFEVETKSNLGEVFLAPGMERARDDLREAIAKVHDLFDRRFHSHQDVDVEFKLVQEGDHRKLYLKQARFLGSTAPQ